MRLGFPAPPEEMTPRSTSTSRCIPNDCNRIRQYGNWHSSSHDWPSALVDTQPPPQSGSATKLGRAQFSGFHRVTISCLAMRNAGVLIATIL
jgi:hypothetical protein